jgi:hypothetical protein
LLLPEGPVLFLLFAWSIKMVAAPYLFLVSLPLSCAMNPGVRDSSWLTEIQSPGEVATRILFLF